MALFNFRKNADLQDGTGASQEPVESVEVLRKRTLHRLIGSAILVAVGVVVFSLVFDRQPRPVPVDIAIQIPSKESQPPLVIGAPLPAAPTLPTQPTADTQTAAPVAAASVASAPAPVVAPAPAAASAPPPAVVPAPVTPPPVPAAKPAAKEVKETKAETSKQGAEAQRVKDLLEGKAPAASAAKAASSSDVSAPGKFIVQVGAYADAAKARQTRLKVEKAGLKTYTHVADTAEGKRIRVRVGPFASRDEADKAAKKIKSLDLPAVVLTL